MSIEATLDLRTNFSPRSLCVFTAVTDVMMMMGNSGGLLLGTGGGSAATGGNPIFHHHHHHHTGGSSSRTNPFDNYGGNTSITTTPTAPRSGVGAGTTTTTPSSSAPGGGGGYHHQQYGTGVVLCTVYGSERGSLHYRTFAAPMKRGGGGGGGGGGGVVSTTSTSTATTTTTTGSLSSSSAGSARQLTASSSSSTRMQIPLGLQGSSGSSSAGGSSSSSLSGRSPASTSSNIPRGLYPVDLSAGSLRGPVVSCIRLSSSAGDSSSNRRSSSSSSSSSPVVFLLLVDDNRGASANQPGVYQAVMVTLSVGSGSSSSSAGGGGGGGAIFHTTVIGGGRGGTLPRMSCAAYHETAGLVYGMGRTVASLSPDLWEEEATRRTATSSSSSSRQHSQHRSSSSSSSSVFRRFYFGRPNLLPAPGIRSGQDAIALTAHGRVAVVAVGNSFYAIAGQEADDRPTTMMQDPAASEDCVKILSFAQSSQVHPVIVLDVGDVTLDADWSCLFLASGRECAIIDLYFGPPSDPRISYSKPRNSVVTVASPILAAAESWPWIALLTSDGLISIRSPSCLAIPLRTVEVGQRPNDYFVLRTLRDDRQVAAHYHHHQQQPWIVAIAYSGEGRILQCQPDTAQDMADRLMRHAIDAFGANGFPRSELAEAVNASFTATSYVGPEATPHSRSLLRQYLEAVLGLADFEGGGTSGWPTEFSMQHQQVEVHHGAFAASGGGATGHDFSFSGRGSTPRPPPPATVVSSAPPAVLLTGTALLCLVCIQLSPPNSSLANRAAKGCAEKLGILMDETSGDDSSRATAQVCEMVADRLLREAASNFSLLMGGAPTPPIARMNRTSHSTIQTDFIESAIWLLRGCGRHERAIDVAYERLQLQSQSHHSGDPTTAAITTTGSSSSSSSGRGFWSQIKYESYTATHLSELWASGKEDARRLVLRSPATHRLLEDNPRLGLSVFTAMHPQNEGQWRSMLARDDPLMESGHVFQVVELLKSINPAVPYDRDQGLVTTNSSSDDFTTLPLDSGRAVAVTFLESAIGISTGRRKEDEDDVFDTLPMDNKFMETVSNFHDELSFLLLEGVIAERRDNSSSNDDDDDDGDKPLGSIYRQKLRSLLKWPLAKIRPDQFMNSLPSSFLYEKALVLGRIGRHEDALRILYRDLSSLDLALEYCDDRYERQKANQEKKRARQQQIHQPSMFPEFEGGMDAMMMMGHDSVADEDNAYLPLVRVALESADTERGTTAAIQVLALRRGAIDRAAALRLLPSDVPVSAVARPFLIPALVDSESQVRRLTVVSALLRARYLRLKDALTTAQLKAQSNLHVVPQLRSLNLGDPLHSTKAFRARTNATASASASGSMPDVMIVKYFFPRHLVIQAKVTNAAGISDKYSRTLADIAFVVAESSEEAIQPLLQVPIQVLPSRMTGSCWCVLSAYPSRMDGTTAQLTCELRYTVQSVDATNNSGGGGGGGGIFPDVSGNSGAVMGRTYVEELQDLEVHAAHFS